jgi:asparagine synthase (glutamine-hydrolysing)
MPWSFQRHVCFCTLDNQESTIYLVRDPSGIKPLYFAITKEGLAFASELRAFKPFNWLQEKNKNWPVISLHMDTCPNRNHT